MCIAVHYEILISKAGQEVDQRKLGEIVEKDYQVHGLNRENATDHSKWIKLLKQIRDN